MGYHTWFYTKKDISLEDAKNLAIKRLQENIDSTNDLFLTKDFELTDESELIFWLGYYTRILDWVNRGWIVESVYRILSDVSLDIDRYDKKTGNCYINIDHYHDIFRIGGYTENLLLSLDETLKFIEENKFVYYHWGEQDKRNRTELKKQAIKRLEEFWDKYPNGAIDFG